MQYDGNLQADARKIFQMRSARYRLKYITLFLILQQKTARFPQKLP